MNFSSKNKININEYINSVISQTWNLKNLREEIYSSSNFLVSINEHLMLNNKKKTFALNNAKFFYDIIIEDYAGWTIKKEVLKIFIKCLHQMNDKERYDINESIYISNSNYKFYIYKLFDTITIYGDYDFQALVIELIFLTSYEEELRNITNQLIPESEELQILFSKITIKYFKETVRCFLNILNKRSNKIFSINCLMVKLGLLECKGGYDEKGVWVDFNIVDGAVSWYIYDRLFICNKTLDQTQEDENNSWNLITFFRNDVDKITTQRLTRCINVTVVLKNSCLCFHEKYQSIIDSANTVCFQLNITPETNYLISYILPKMFYGKIAERIENKVEKNTHLKYNDLRNSPKVLEKRTSSSHYGDFDPTTSSQRYVDKKSTSDLDLTEETHVQNKTVLTDKYVNIPSKNHPYNLRSSVICMKSELDLLNFNSIKESDIDNMSVCFASNEQLLSMASNFDAITSFLCDKVPTRKHTTKKSTHSKSSISSVETKIVYKRMKNPNKRRKTFTNSHSSLSKNSTITELEECLCSKGNKCINNTILDTNRMSQRIEESAYTFEQLSKKLDTSDLQNQHQTNTKTCNDHSKKSDEFSSTKNPEQEIGFLDKHPPDVVEKYIVNEDVKRSVLVLDDKGIKIANNYYVMEYELEVDILLQLIRRSQQYHES